MKGCSCLRRGVIGSAYRYGRRALQHSRLAQLGFECSSSNWNLVAHSDQLERAVEHACPVILGQSGIFSEKVYERFKDMKDAGPDPLNTILGHRLQVTGSPSAVVGAWRTELAGIGDRLDGAPDLSFVTIPFTAVCDYATFRDSEIDLLGARVLAVVANIRSNLASSDRIAFGIEFNTEFLSMIESELAKGEDLAPVLRKLTRVIGTLHAHAGMRILLIAGEGLDFRQKLELSIGAGERSPPPLAVVGTDLFRAHPRRPGVYCTEDISVLPPLPVAVEELKRALDSCMALERKYMEQIHDGDVRESVSLQTLCLGHVLAAQFLETNPSTMRLLDEWEFVKETQLNRGMSAAFETLRSRNKQTREWLLVYQPVNRFLVSKFEDFLRVQQLDIQTHIFDSIKKQTDFNSGPQTKSELSSVPVEVQDEILKCVRSEFASLDLICTSGTRRIESMDWNSSKRASLEPNKLETIYHSIGSVLQQYYPDV